jgi:hypothetical protein
LDAGVALNGFFAAVFAMWGSYVSSSEKRRLIGTVPAAFLRRVV